MVWRIRGPQSPSWSWTVGKEFLTYKECESFWLGLGFCGPAQGCSVPCEEVVVCVPEWKCKQLLDGIEVDGCGNERFNPICEPCISNWQCESWSLCSNTIQSRECDDGCGNTDTESQYCCTSEWKCKQPLDGKESDSCGNERFNQACVEIPPPPPIQLPSEDNNMLIGIASLIGLVGLGYIAFDEILKKKQ